MEDMACSFFEKTINELKLIYIENQWIKASILVSKGADVFELIWKPTGTDFLAKTKQGLECFSGRDLKNNRLKMYSELYAGGWQDVLPHRGIYEDHEVVQQTAGIAATLPWEYTVDLSVHQEISLVCFVHLPLFPLFVEKRFTLKINDPTLYVRESVKNVGTSSARFTWTQHSAFGGSFLDENVRILLPDSDAFQPRKYDLEKNRGIEFYEESLDSVTFKSGEKRSLLKVYPHEMKDDCFVALKNLKKHVAVLYHTRKQLGLLYKWDGKVFPFIRYYYNSGINNYFVALEPSNDCFVSFDSSLRYETYLHLDPGQTCDTWLSLKVFSMKSSSKTKAFL